MGLSVEEDALAGATASTASTLLWRGWVCRASTASSLGMRLLASLASRTPAGLERLVLLRWSAPILNRRP